MAENKRETLASAADIPVADNRSARSCRVNKPRYPVSWIIKAHPGVAAPGYTVKEGKA